VTGGWEDAMIGFMNRFFFLFGVCACAPTKTLNPKPETLIWARGQWRVRALIRVDEDGKQGDACCVPKP